MGSENIDFTLKNKASQSEILKAFKDRQIKDRSYNGSREGYSGDFQTVDKVDFHLDKFFLNFDEAYNYCLEKAKKWESVVAVYYTNLKVKSKSVINIDNKIKDLKSKYDTLDRMGLNTKKKFQTCLGCQSKLNIKKLNSDRCPVCRDDLRSKSILKRLHNMKQQIETLELKKKLMIEKEREKLSKESNIQFSTLVAGWGAC